jgi:pSer/pThr/pTyr-binding forkhead associated (FHA) protein
MRDDATGQLIKGSVPLGLQDFYGTKPHTPCAVAGDGRLALPQNKKITLSVVGGPSKGRMVEITTPRISIGRAGGGADIQLDDPTLSDLHCALGVTLGEMRLCDLESRSGTYLNNERVESAELEHMSEFRVGSSYLLLIVVAKLK